MLHGVLADMLRERTLLLVVEGALRVQVLWEVADGAWCRLIWRSSFDLGVDGLIQTAVLERVLWVDELLAASGGRVKCVVMVVVFGLLRRRRRVLGHLR